MPATRIDAKQWQIRQDEKDGWRPLYRINARLKPHQRPRMKGKPSAKTLKRLRDAFVEAMVAGDRELAASLNGQISACHRRIAEQEAQEGK
jgi:hypothetical protein